MDNRECNLNDQAEREKELYRELEEFKQEKERVKKVLGSLGGSVSTKKEKLINVGFLMFVLFFFVMELTTHWLPSFVSLEIGLLALSIKIIWMMRSTHKVNHFQFWILNSIEFRVGMMDKKLSALEKKLEEKK